MEATHKYFSAANLYAIPAAFDGRDELSFADTENYAAFYAVAYSDAKPTRIRKLLLQRGAETPVELSRPLTSRRYLEARYAGPERYEPGPPVTYAETEVRSHYFEETPSDRGVVRRLCVRTEPFAQSLEYTEGELTKVVQDVAGVGRTIWERDRSGDFQKTASIPEQVDERELDDEAAVAALTAVARAWLRNRGEDAYIAGVRARESAAFARLPSWVAGPPSASAGDLARNTLHVLQDCRDTSVSLWATRAIRQAIESRGLLDAAAPDAVLLGLILAARYTSQQEDFISKLQDELRSVVSTALTGA